jgi:hypothetical protein
MSAKVMTMMAAVMAKDEQTAKQNKAEAQRTAQEIEADRARQEDIRRNGKSKKDKKKMVKMTVGQVLSEPVETQVDADYGHVDYRTPDEIDQDERDAQRILYTMMCNYFWRFRVFTHTVTSNVMTKPGCQKTICKKCHQEGRTTYIPRTVAQTGAKGNGKADFDEYGRRKMIPREDGKMILGKANPNGLPTASCKECGNGLVYAEIKIKDANGQFIEVPYGALDIDAHGKGHNEVLDYLANIDLLHFAHDGTTHPSEEDARNHAARKGMTQCKHCDCYVEKTGIVTHLRNTCPVIKAKNEERVKARQQREQELKEHEVAKTKKAEAVKNNEFVTVTRQRATAKVSQKTSTEKVCGTCGKKFQSTYAGKAKPCCPTCFHRKKNKN